jgi:V/A-type H+-transporting ATPase subunit E
MALQDVKNDILREAREKANKIEEEAQREANEILEEAEEEAEEIKAEAKDEIEDEKEAERKKVVSNARMEARQEKLSAKQEKIQEIFSNFRQEVRDLSGDEREKLVKQAVEDAEFDVAKVQAREDYREAVDERKIEFEEKDVDGFVLVSENGERSKNYSVDKIVDSLKSQYRKQVADKLFGEVDE